MGCGKRCGCAGKCNCLVYGDGAGVETDCCIEVTGNGSSEVPYVVNNLCPGSWMHDNFPDSMGEDGCGIQTMMFGTGTCDDPYSANIGVIISTNEGNRIVCDPADPGDGGGLFVPPILAGPCIEVTDTPSGTTVGVLVDPDGENMLSCGPAGLLVPPPDAEDLEGLWGCGIRTAGEEVEVATSATDIVDAYDEHVYGPPLPEIGCTDSTEGAPIFCDENGELRTLPLPRVRPTRIPRATTVGMQGPCGTLPQGQEGTSADGFHLLEESAGYPICNPSNCYYMDVQLDVRGRTRIDLTHPSNWCDNIVFGAQLRLGIEVTGALLGNGTYIIQRSQVDTQSNDVGPPWPDPNENKYQGNWTDFDSPPVLRVRPGECVTIRRFADFIWTGECSSNPGNVPSPNCDCMCRLLLWNLPGITSLGIAAPVF